MERKEPTFSKPDMDEIRFREPARQRKSDSGNGLVWKIAIGVFVGMSIKESDWSAPKAAGKTSRTNHVDSKRACRRRVATDGLGRIPRELIRPLSWRVLQNRPRAAESNRPCIDSPCLPPCPVWHRLSRSRRLWSLKRPFLRVGQLTFLSSRSQSRHRHRHRSLIASTLDSERNVHCETGRPLKYEKLGTNAENTPTATLITR